MVEYIRYNRTRMPEFQICTEIIDCAGKKQVVKRALTNKAKMHICSFTEKRKILQANYKNIDAIKVEIIGDKAVFPYLAGETIDNVLETFMGNWDSLFRNLAMLADEIFCFRDNVVTPFQKTEAFQEVFGDIGELEGDSISGSNIDMIFENLFLSDGKLYCVDYEWVFSFPIPIGFLKYRCLHYFYIKYEKYLKSKWEYREFLLLFGITEVETYAAMENGFQEYVFGRVSGNYYLSRYAMREEEFKEILKHANALEERNVYVKQIEDELDRRGKHIQKQDAELERGREEIERLNNEIEKLGAWGQGLDEEVKILRQELESQLSYKIKQLLKKRLR